MRNYLLAIERNRNDYMPIDWSLLPNCESINIFSLEEIDNLTSQYGEDVLKMKLLKENLIDVDDFSKPLVIIYEENDKKRKLQYDIMQEGEQNDIQEGQIINFIVKNSQNKDIINKLFNYFKDKNVSNDLKNILTEINDAKYKHTVFLLRVLEKLSYIPYNEKRELGLFISRTLNYELEKNSQEAKLVVKKEN